MLSALIILYYSPRLLPLYFLNHLKSFVCRWKTKWNVCVVHSLTENRSWSRSSCHRASASAHRWLLSSDNNLCAPVRMAHSRWQARRAQRAHTKYAQSALVQQQQIIKMYDVRAREMLCHRHEPCRSCWPTTVVATTNSTEWRQNWSNSRIIIIINRHTLNTELR